METFLCGTAKECITPPAALLPRLVGLKQKRFAGVIDDIYVRAIAISNGQGEMLIVGFEMTSAPCSEEILHELSAEIGVPQERILFFAIHTHAVPFNDIDLEKREAQSEDTLAASLEYTAFLKERLIKAAKTARERMIPAKVGYGWGESHINVSRIQTYRMSRADGSRFDVLGLGADPSKEADPTLFVLKIEAEDGKPLAFFINYAMHNVATIWNDMDGTGRMGVSGDIGGMVSGLLEEQYAGSVAIWSSGAAGDLNPLMLNEVVLQNPQTEAIEEYPPSGMDFALNCRKMMAYRQFADVKRTLESIVCDKAAGEIAGAVEWSITDGCDCIRHRDRAPEFIVGAEVPKHTVRLQMLRLGDLYLFGVGAELYSSIGKSLLSSTSRDVVLITHNASTLCNSHYILDDETIAGCDASEGRAMIPGYDEYRCLAGVMTEDMREHLSRLMEEVDSTADELR